MRILRLDTGSELPQGTVGHMQLNFGQELALPTFDASIIMSKAELQSKLARAYDQFVFETRCDGEDGELLHDAGYPPFPCVLRDAELLWFVLDECLVFDLLASVAPNGDPEFEINRLCGLEFDSQEVRILCRVHRSLRYSPPPEG